MEPTHVFVLVLIFTSLAQATVDDDSPVIQTGNGPIMGRKYTSTWTNKTVYAFNAIPYASPPIASLRFKEPVPPQNWTEVKNCTVDGAWCMQAAGFGMVADSTNEDCLFVNVYSPQVSPTGALWPVMVWVHGGAWLYGSGAYSQCGPDLLVGEGVVVVTLNYRLGAFGFLSLGIPDAPGNAALKDQALAFEWVRSEIEKFGGDPNRVTISGESAGSFSVHLHYLSPLSKGLFHAVIGESGTAFTMAAREDGLPYALKLADLLNCSYVDAASALTCLTTASAEDILTYQSQITLSYEEQLTGGLVWSAVVDKNSSQDPFLPAMPLELYQQAQGSFVPFLMGTNRDEGILHTRAENVIVNITNLDNLELFLPEEVRSASTDVELHTKALQIDNFYFNNETATNMEYLNLYTDVMMAYPTSASARMFRDRDSVFVYYFVFDGAFKSSGCRSLSVFYGESLVCHAEEVNYIFVIEGVNQTVTLGSDAENTWRRMVRMWTNFVKYHTPTTAISDAVLQDVTWLPIDMESTRYLRIDTNLTMMNSDYIGPSADLWDSVSTMPSACSHLPASTLVLVFMAVLCFVW